MLSLRHLFRKYRRRRASRIDWAKRHAKVLAFHPELGRPRADGAEKAHLDLWRPLRKDISIDTYRICANLSGIDDPRFVPEELFVSELQDLLYPDPGVRRFADKNGYDRWFGEALTEAQRAQRTEGGVGVTGFRSYGVLEPPACRGDAPRRLVPGAASGEVAETRNPEQQKGRAAVPPSIRHQAPSTKHPAPPIFPVTFLRKIDGKFSAADYREVAADHLTEWIGGLPYPVVCKPSRDSFGGRNIAFCRDAERLETILLNPEPGTRNLVVQERIQPHEFFARFSPVGLNTLRVYCYRDLASGRWHVLNVTLRMGVGGSLDNETDGGIACSVNNDGSLNNYALDKYAGKFYTHPDRGIAFNSVTIPDMEGLRSLALYLARQISGARLVGLDMCMDANSRWRCLEINLGMQTIRFSQYAGKPFFGNFTAGIVERLSPRH